jgi:hypothetical protein
MHTIPSRIENGQKQLRDPIRKKWVAATPEEEVRQHWIVYLLHTLRVPLSMIEIEWCLSHLQGQAQHDLKRVDAVVWKPNGTNAGGLVPWLLLECKAPHVSLDTWSSPIQLQVARYLDKLPTSFLVVSNGSQTRYWQRGEKEYEPINGLPYYK